MPTRIANANWEGDFKRGGGTVAVDSGLLGASHASCFTMALSVVLSQAGTPPESLATEAKVTVDQVEGGFGITKIALSVRGKVPGIDEAAFVEAANAAKANCPLSKALAA